jgi:hypothetical protein
MDGGLTWMIASLAAAMVSSPEEQYCACAKRVCSRRRR